MLIRCLRHSSKCSHGSLNATLCLHVRGLASAASQQQNVDIYDIVCVGGGPAGLALATALKSNARTAGLKIALIDGQDLHGAAQRFKTITGYSNRCSSLTPASKLFLQGIGAWQDIDTSRTQPYHSMQVWDGVSGSSIHFDPAQQTSPGILELLFPQPQNSSHNAAVATMTENANLTSALLSRLSSLPDVHLLPSTRVESIDLGTETSEYDLRSWPIVTTSSSDTRLAARLLIGADGFNSPVRSFSDITSRGWDYDRHGLVATLDTSGPGWGGENHKTAYQRFLPTGPIAFLPLPGNKASLVWSTTPAHAAKLKRLSPEDFTAMVNAAFRLLPVDIDYMLASMPDNGQAEEVAWRETATSFAPEKIPQKVVGVQDGSIASFPLRMRHADTYVGDRVALIGDAAHTIHPLAGQGLNQGLGDAKALVESIDYAMGVGWDIGSSWSLDRYNAAQWGKNNAMIGTVDKLHKLYSAGSGPVVWARSLGLDLVNRADWMKGLFMKAAAGR